MGQLGRDISSALLCTISGKNLSTTDLSSMISNMKKGGHLKIDETSCGPMCQHPACWQSNTRRDKGFPKMAQPVQPAPDIELGMFELCSEEISTELFEE